MYHPRPWSTLSPAIKIIVNETHTTQKSTSLALIQRRRPRYVPFRFRLGLRISPEEKPLFMPSLIPSFQVESTQIINPSEPAQPLAFASYHSLLDHHPLLRERSLQDSSSQLPAETSRHGISSTASQPFTLNLELLKQSSMQKYLSSGSGRICQYEVPGGGECRDQNCEDIHLSRVSSVEPSAEDTAQYLCVSVPAGPRYGVKAFRDALDVARLRYPTMSFDTRVQEALTSLGLR
ncbi:hypothetical protein BC628DRAFT_215349 [Trametes gibbosa]|nr:hypothetical protein BC628DRAFT_215349 [Trametes gibbosa]